MIYLRLAGGLGNQLYQLAAASLMSQMSRISTPVLPLLDGLRQYDEPRDPDSIELLQDNNWLSSTISTAPSLLQMLTLDLRAGRWLPFIGVSDRNYWKIVSQGCMSIRLLDGYFQQGWTHETFNRAISNMSPRTISKKAAERITSNEVIIHIRGGDFLRLSQFQIVDINYYIRAVRQAKNRGWKEFAVISDDLVYSLSILDQIRAHITDINLRLIPAGVHALEDFDTLRAASARIIGNSTFAWWAAVFGSPNAPTWSPEMFTVDCRRDFFLPNEICLA